MKWRYIPPFSAAGDLQLALDHWLLDQCDQGIHPPTLRFYTWYPTTISVGYFQKKWPPHWSHLAWRGKPIPIVRRPSGGRAVLHHGDLTYAIIAPDLPGPKRQVYEHLCSFLIEGWRRLGISLSYGHANRGYHQQVNCFQVSTPADLVCPHGFKLIGSAQCWRQRTVLQHGSIQLSPNLALHQQVFGDSWRAKSHPPTFPALEDIIPVLMSAATDVFQAEFEMSPLQESEWSSLEPYRALSAFDHSKTLDQRNHGSGLAPITNAVP